MARKTSTSSKPKTNKKKTQTATTKTSPKKGKNVKDLTVEIPAHNDGDDEENVELPRNRRSTRRGAVVQKVSYAEYGDSATEDDDSDDEEDHPISKEKRTLPPKPVSATTAKSSTPKSKKAPIKMVTKKATTKKSPSPLASISPVINPSPSIREITKNMWSPNKGDWRVSGAIDYD